MAEIALRAYVKEIDDLVEHEQLDEAIAHSRHVLETYPKHLDTYRLLGKAYLEAKRYGDAADLFQRVLSAVPDDFVAHIGMSIVREDEGNLDASIWHMERAFETNPANPAIQQELRRLIGKRDGLEPHKVRLTRGALARMYAHGELYPQAIAELRSALQEDPDRPDLQVLLANLYWRTDQKEQAAEVAQQILTKLPFCRDANRIAAGYLQGIGRSDDATASHRRLASLDPYAAFVETAMVDPAGVDPGSVRLQKLEWHPGRPVAAADLSRPSWTDSLGAGLRAETKASVAAAVPEGPVPIWLASEAPSQPPPQTPTPAPTPAAPPPAATAPEEESSPPIVHPFAGAKAPPPAEIPTWMREAGWSESTGEAAEGPMSFTDEELAGAAAAGGEGELAPASIPDWLKDIAPQEITEAGAQAAAPSMPDWQAEAAAAESGAETTPPSKEPEPAPGPAKGSEVPTWLEEPSPGATETIVTWLGDRSARAAAFQQPPSPPAEPEPAPEAEQPDWLTQGGFLDEEPAKEAPSEPEGPPAWLTGVAEAAASEEILSAEPPSWVSEAAPEPPEPEEEATPAPSPSPEAPDWLRAIAEPGAVPAASEEPGSDWLAGLSSAVASPSRSPEAGGPEWLRGIGEPEEAAPQPEQRPAPDWLQGLAGTPPAPAPEPAAAGPDWLREAPSTPKPAPAAPFGAAGANIDWLKGIGEEAESHAPAEAPAPSAGDDWLRGLAELGAEGGGEQPAPAAEEGAAWGEGESEEAEAAPAETPDWLGRLASSAPTPETPAASQQPSWLEEVASEGGAEAVEEPDWLKGMPGVPQGGPQPALEPEAEAEDWLKGLLDETSLPQEPAPAPAPEAAAEPDWFALEGSAEEIGEDTSARIRTATTGWLREVGEQPLPPDALEPPPAPDWLQEFEAAGGQAARPSDQTAVNIKGRVPGQRPGEPRPPIGAMDASAAGELGEDDVQKWLEALASRQEGGSGAAIEEAPPAEAASFFPPAGPAEEAGLPEEAGEGIEWLEQMAGTPQPPREPSVASWQPVEQEPEQPPAPQAPAGEPEEEEVPDWLRSLAAESPPPEPAEEPAVAEEQGPDWLLTAAASTVVSRASLPAAEVPAPAEPTSEEEEPEEEEAPEWLRIPAAEEPSVPAKPEPSAEKPGELEEAPDWLLSSAAEPETVEPPPGYEEEETGMPDWLREAAEAPEAAEALTSQPVEPEAIQEAPRAPEPTAPAAAPEPTWMRPSEPAIARPAPSESEILVPEWLRVPVEALKPEREPEPAIHEPVAEAPKPVAEAPKAPATVEPKEVQAPVAPIAPPPVAPAPVAVRPVPQPEAPKPVIAEVPAPPKPPKARTTARSILETLAAARQALASNDLQTAARHYGTLIRRRSLLDDVMADLKVAVERLPDSPELWQALGDAYMKADRAAEAVEAYRHGLATL
jgi:tetratricopeptide (TPR) repeat protein